MVGAAQECAAVLGNSPPPFLSKTYDMVGDPSTDAVVSWSNNSNSFVVWNVPDFSRDVLPKFFKHSNFSSFVRQLNTYGFRKVDPDRYEFANEEFLRGKKHLLKNITRRKATHAQSLQQNSQVPSASVGSYVGVGKFGFPEDVEMLKRDKNVLMQELVRLRQQQQATDNQLQTVGKRVHLMEQRQQRMMSFLAKAMQSPGFVAQLVNQPTEGNRRISGVSKKRRVHNPGGENVVRNLGIPSPDGQVVKYQPLMNEAAKAVLLQILKTHASGRMEKKMNNANGFLIDKMHSSNNALDIGDSCSWYSGINFSEVPPTSSQSHLAMESGNLYDCPLAAISGVQSSPTMVSQEGSAAQIPETNAVSSEDKAAFCKLPSAQVPGNDNNIPDISLAASKTASLENKDVMPDSGDAVLPVVSGGVLSDPDVDVLLDDMPKLPGINDVFWEQFLAASPLHGDMDEINSSILGFGIEKVQDLQSEQENEWDKMKHLNHLTEQMGLLAAGSLPE